MFDPQMCLISAVFARTAAALASAAPAPDKVEHGWSEARQALEPTRAAEPELARIVDARDGDALRALVADWHAGKQHLPLQDREVLSRAVKAFRKSLKVTKLAAESSIAGGPMSSGRRSSIVGMRPPSRYPAEVWEELVRQKRLKASGNGMFELPPE